MRALEKGAEYRRRRGAGNSESACFPQDRPLWRDVDLLHVFTIVVLVNMASFGAVYLWFFVRTMRAARRSPRDPGRIASIIVFGKRLAQGRPDIEFRWRLRHALRLLRADPDVVVVLSGGQSGSPDEPSEAHVAREWLLCRIPEAVARLRVEERSRHTIDNLREARRLLPDGPVALLSNRYHLARCLALARSLGMDAHACAAEPVLRGDRRTITRLVKEAGYHMIFTVGRTWARVTGHRRMLSRIG